MGPRLTPYRPATSAVVSTGPRPGDHTIRTEPRDCFEHAQRRPGPRPRRHLIRSGTRTSRPETLNEGRGRDPGDTRVLAHQVGQPHGRSTKAGAETPATRLTPPRTGARWLSLNEGRGRDPGDTSPHAGRRSPYPSLNEGRGRDPGDTLESIRCVDDRLPPLNEGRGRDPGDTSPHAGRRSPYPSLNEGRGRDPGDTLMWLDQST